MSTFIALFKSEFVLQVNSIKFNKDIYKFTTIF